MPAMIDSPGRVQRYSRADDPVIVLLEDSGIPLTGNDASRLLAGIMKAIRRSFRAVPGQSRAKPYMAKPAAMRDAIVSAFSTPRRTDLAAALPRALGALLDNNRLAAILYREFRSEAIHGGRAFIDEAGFFRRREPYWTTWHFEDVGSAWVVQFPAPFLVNLLRDCSRTFRQHLLARGHLPPRVANEVFGDDVDRFIEFVDVDLIPEPRSLRLNTPRR